MRKSTIAIGIAAALSTQAFVASTNADAAVKTKPRTASGPVNTQAHFKYPNHSRPSGTTVLYDQISTPNDNGVPDQLFQSTYDAYTSQGADDFVVTDAAGWTVSGFNFLVSFQVQGVPSPPPAGTQYDLTVFADAGGLPGAVVCTYTDADGTLDGTDTNLSVSLPTPCVLAQGTYWISFQPDLTFPPQSFWLNFAGSGALGTPAVWQNPGDGFGTGCTSWSPVSTCVGSGTIGGGLPNNEFQVVGAVGGGNPGTCTAGDLCLVSTVGTDTSSGACGTADTIDASVGDQLNFCYTVTNNTGVALDYHTLQNNVDGTLFSLLNQPLANGASFQYNHIETVSTTNTYNSTWTGQDLPPGYSAAVETPSGGDCSDRIFADGFDGTPVPCPGGSNFVDITGTGTPLGLSDDGAVDVTMPFSFNFYGTTSNILTVGNNGGALFNTPGSGLPFNNVSLPASLSGPAMLPLWDDFDSESGDVYTDTRGTTPNRQFIVEWFDRVHFSGPDNTDGATFELIVNEDGTIQFEYLDVQYTGLGNASNPPDPDDCSDGVCATIGLQNDTTLFNQYSAFEASITDNSGLKWTPTAPQVFTGTDSVTVNVGAPAIVVNNGNPITGAVPVDGTSNIVFPLANTGNRDLNWSLTEAGPDSKLHFPPAGSRFVMPMGNPATKTSRPAPIALRHPTTKKGANGRNHFHVPFGSPVPVFAADIYSNIFETFDALNPSATTEVSATDGTAWVGGAFIDGDFSKLYMIAGNFAANPDMFGTVDTASGSITMIGSATNSLGEGYSGLAYDTTSGTLYAASGTCGSSSHLWTIDKNTGAATLVGEITNSPCTVAIAINADGAMYALDIVNDSLVAVDKTTGEGATIGSIGYSANYAQDMAFDQSTGILYIAGFDAGFFSDSIYTADLTTGLATLVGPIGPSIGEVDAMGIETAGGPCSQPQDLPWLSLNPTSGTTAAGDTTNITAGIDGTGTADGDVLSGTVCATSNDPANHTVATPIDVTVGGTAPGSVVDSGVLNISINADFTGLYINWLTGCTITSDGGDCPEGTDFNPWSADGVDMNFFFPSDDSGKCLASDGSTCDVLASGAVIGSTQVYATGSSANFAAGNTSGYLGFSFINANTLAVNYGYAKFTTTGPGGFPATLVEYWYDNSGAAITIP